MTKIEDARHFLCKSNKLIFFSWNVNSQNTKLSYRNISFINKIYLDNFEPESKLHNPPDNIIDWFILLQCRIHGLLSGRWPLCLRFWSRLSWRRLLITSSSGEMVKPSVPKGAKTKGLDVTGLLWNKGTVPSWNDFPRITVG